MSVTPLPMGPTSRRPGQHLITATAARIRQLPDSRGLARRRIVITLIKFSLPALALLLLVTLAAWPEIDRLRDNGRLSYDRVSRDAGGATLSNVRYRSVDDHGRPYTVTAVTAQQVDDDRINLTTLKGDITLTDGTWLMLQSQRGVYLKHSDQLDLAGHVILYRDDGTTMTTASASVDMKNGAAAGAEPTHAEGPFGTLDAQGFTVTDKGTAIQFAGPAHLVMNGSSQ
jgi:lipopolysaccharide export system protein LptC